MPVKGHRTPSWSSRLGNVYIVTSLTDAGHLFVFNLYGPLCMISLIANQELPEHYSCKRRIHTNQL